MKKKSTPSSTTTTATTTPATTTTTPSNKNITKNSVETKNVEEENVSETMMDENPISDEENAGDEETIQQDIASAPKSNKVISKPLNTTKKVTKKIEPGVLYFSRIPPQLRPHALRRMLDEYGAIGRIYLAPEDKAVVQSRHKKGLKGRRFTDGWVEFLDKRIAKRVALTLNATPMGGSKRNPMVDDLWCVKYLSGFKWDDLHERARMQRDIRHSRVRAEVNEATKEVSQIMQSVELSKMITAMEKRKKRTGSALKNKNTHTAHQETNALSQS